MHKAFYLYSNFFLKLLEDTSNTGFQYILDLIYWSISLLLISQFFAEQVKFKASISSKFKTAFLLLALWSNLNFWVNPSSQWPLPRIN